MSFLFGSPPPIPPPPPTPPTMANPIVAETESAARNAAAAAAGQSGFNRTVRGGVRGQQGAPAPETAKMTLFGSGSANPPAAIPGLRK